MCKKCGKKIIQTEVYRSTNCQFCGQPLHSCINCKFYSPGSHYDCHETIEELVKDKESANFCDFFSINKTDFSLQKSSSNLENSQNLLNHSTKACDAKAAFNALFSD